MITGGASGLGKYLCVEFARRNVNIVIVDIDERSMHSLAIYLERNFDISVKTVVADLSSTTCCMDLYLQLRTWNIKINILVNNAGMGGTYAFENKTVEQMMIQLQLNVSTPAILTRLFITDMNLEREHGYILNVASLAGFFHLPGKQVYGASKAFLVSLSRSLEAEYRNTNVVISVLCPGGMNTNLDLVLKHRRCNLLSRLSIMEPGDVAKVAVDGLFRKKKVIVPGFLNRLFLIAGKCMPGSVSNYLSRGQMTKLMSEDQLAVVRA